MADPWVRFTFTKRVPFTEVAGTLRLACLAAEALHGAERVRLEARYDLDAGARTVAIRVDSEVGKTLAVVFSGYARREFGEDAVRTDRVGAELRQNVLG